MTVAHDPSALNQAEWIKYIGAFFNQEDVAKTCAQCKGGYKGTLLLGVIAQLPRVPKKTSEIMKVRFNDFPRNSMSFH